MSKLKISDLSFCEAELSRNSQVQGGCSSSSESDPEPEDYNTINYFYNEEDGSQGSDGALILILGGSVQISFVGGTSSKSFAVAGIFN